MSKIKDLTGQKFGDLTAVEIAGKTPQGSVLWRCLCDCGNETKVRSYSLTNKTTRSCGCSKTKNAKKRVLDLTGQKFGRLLVTGSTDKRVAGRICWECLCDCGTIKTVISNNLVKGTTTSCGCYNRELNLGNKYSIKLDSGASYLYEVYRSNAQAKGLTFLLEYEQLKKITSSGCVYCGTPPSKVICSRKAKVPYTYNGIDRKDNNKGYELGNCLPCCSFCNYAKRNHTYDEFLSWVSRLVDYQNKKITK